MQKCTLPLRATVKNFWTTIFFLTFHFSELQTSSLIMLNSPTNNSAFIFQPDQDLINFSSSALPFDLVTSSFPFICDLFIHSFFPLYVSWPMTLQVKVITWIWFWRLQKLVERWRIRMWFTFNKFFLFLQCPEQTHRKNTLQDKKKKFRYYRLTESRILLENKKMKMLEMWNVTYFRKFFHTDIFYSFEYLKQSKKKNLKDFIYKKISWKVMKITMILSN